MNLPIGEPATPSPTTSLASSPEPRQRTDRRVLLNTGALAGSSLWRIGLSFVLQLLIANRLGVEGLGQYTTALAYLNVSQVLSELGLPALLVRDLAQRPQRRRRYFQLALGLQFLVALLVWAGLAGLTLWLPYQPATRMALLVIGGSLPFFAVTSASETLFQAGERMELVMGVEVFVNTLIVITSIAVLWRGGTVVYLTAVLIGTQAVSAALCLFLLKRSRLLATQDKVPGRRSYFSDLGRLLRSAVPFYGLALANVLLHRMDILLLSALAGEAITGIYSAAYLVVRVLVILSQTYWQALYPTLSRLRHQSTGQYRRLSALGIRYGLMALLPVAALTSSAAEPLLGLIYTNERYNASVPVFQVLIWAAPLFLMSTYTVNLLLVERRPQQSLLIAAVHLVTVSLLLPPLTATWQALGAAIAMTMAIALSATTGILFLKRRRGPAVLPRSLSLLLLATASAGLVGAFLPLPWPIRLALGALLYAGIIWWRGILAPSDLHLFRKALQR